MSDAPTCGTGLAEHAVLPARLGDLVAAFAGVLEQHLEALDPDDESARPERVTYLALAADGRRIASQLRELAGKMAGSRDLPMGRHDEDKMSSPRAADAFATFVARERELLSLLQEWVERN